jgi:sugar lactone lactonase YvrE
VGSIVLAIVTLLLGFATNAMANSGSAVASATRAARPSVSKVSPSRGSSKGGLKVTIRGSGFTKVRVVRFGTAKARKVRVLSRTRLTAVTPVHAHGSVSVSVTTASGSSRKAKAARFVFYVPAATVTPPSGVTTTPTTPTTPNTTPITPAAAAPTISSISPSSGAPTSGGTVTLTGTGFASVKSVTFGSASASAVNMVSSSDLTVTAPQHVAGTVTVTVTTPGGSASTSYTYRIPSASTPTLSILAGLGRALTVGPATSTALYGTWGVAVDSSGNRYIADTNNAVIEKVSPSGQLSVIAGIAGDSQDSTTFGGLATATALSEPTGVAVDSAGDVFISDIGTDTVDEINHSTGEISKIAGGGSGYPSTTPSTATDDELQSPSGIAVTANGDELYIADGGGGGHGDEVYAVNLQAATDNLTLFAGGGNGTPSTTAQSATNVGFSSPDSVAVDGSGNVYIADAGDRNMIYKVNSAQQLTLIAGDEFGGPPTTNPQNPTTVGLSEPHGVAVDGSGDVYVTDSFSFEVVEIAGGELTLVAGDGSDAEPTAGSALQSALGTPYGIAVDSAGDVYIGDYADNTVDELSSGDLSIVAGIPFDAPPTPGPAVDSALAAPIGAAVDGYGDVYIADAGDNTVEEISAQTGDLSVIAGGPDASETPSYTPQPASQVSFGPGGIAVDNSGNVYIADALDDEILEISSGQLRVIAGGGPTTATTTPEAGDELSMDNPQGVAVAANGDVYIADSGDRLVLLLTPAGQVSVVAGGGGTTPSTTPHAATDIALADPGALALDSSGDLYIADDGGPSGAVVDEVNATTQDLSVIAGVEGSDGLPSAGPATSETLEQPEGVAVDGAGNVFITDWDEYTGVGEVDEVNATSHDLSIVAGDQEAGLPGPGAPLSTPLIAPVGIAIDSSGNVYVPDARADDLMEISGL